MSTSYKVTSLEDLYQAVVTHMKEEAPAEIAIVGDEGVTEYSPTP